MKKYQQNQYVEIFYKLPPEIKDVVASSKTTENIWAIAKNHKLQIDQSGELDDIVMDVIMGIIPTKNMVEEIATSCKIPKMDASLISRDIDDQIFRPIKELMRRLYEEGAPFKPESMNTVDEKDEDHSHLDKHDILREIENPTAPEVKVVEGKQLRAEGLELEVEKKNDASFIPSTSKVIEEYHEEIEGGKAQLKTENLGLKENTTKNISAPEASVPNPIEEAKKRLLDNISSDKLSGIVTMPKLNVQVDINETNSTPAPEPSLLRDVEQLPKSAQKFSPPSVEKTSNPIPEATNIIPEVKKPEAPVSTPPTKSYAADPYREPTE